MICFGMKVSKKAIILGSGVSVFEDKEAVEVIPYKDIPGWPLGNVKGHKGELAKYQIDNQEVWVLKGRAHLYEGFSWEQVCFPTSYLINNGIEELVLTNAAGGLNSSFEIGDLMQITGYLNFLKPNLERGNLENILERPTMFETEPMEGIHKGIYVGVHGPNYESDAEVSLFRSLGADAVGMSTIPEIDTIVNHNSKIGDGSKPIKLTAVSVITNVYDKTEDLGHEGVVAAAKQASKKLVKLLGFN